MPIKYLPVVSQEISMPHKCNEIFTIFLKVPFVAKNRPLRWQFCEKKLHYEIHDEGLNPKHCIFNLIWIFLSCTWIINFMIFRIMYLASFIQNILMSFQWEFIIIQIVPTLDYLLLTF